MACPTDARQCTKRVPGLPSWLREARGERACPKHRLSDRGSMAPAGQPACIDHQQWSSLQGGVLWSVECGV
eukprot:365044-Chlamydomonas_euryale.AAC.4